MSEPTPYAPRKCALARCGATFTPTRSYQRFCRYSHARDAGNAIPKAERARRRATKAERHPKARYIYEALEEAEPGMCPWGCERRLPPRARTCCGDAECIAAYQNAYRLGRTEVERGPLKPMSCACGCGVGFTPRDRRQKYATDRCWMNVRNQKQREARRTNPKPKGRPKRGRAITFGKRTESKVIRPFWRSA